MFAVSATSSAACTSTMACTPRSLTDDGGGGVCFYADKFPHEATPTSCSYISDGF